MDGEGGGQEAMQENLLESDKRQRLIAIRMLDCWILSGILSGTTWLPGDTLYGFGRVWVLLFDTCQSGSIMILEGSCGVPF